jgi:ribosomal protein S18 acetylase RimI-like enzyme
MTAGVAEAVPPTRSQTREVGEVLARALHEDPNWLWILPDESRRTRVLPWFMEVLARYCHKYGVVHTTAGKVEGAALWIPPGKYPLSVVRLILAGMILVPLKLGRAAFGRFINGVNYEAELHKRDASPRHWYLATLGVDPPRQGLGIGSTLIQPVLARADAEGLLCYVETEKERNVRFYRKHGFEVVVEADVPNGGPHMWTMKREPRG